MGLKKFIAEYFRFSRRDRIAVFSLIFLILLVYFLPVLITQPASSAHTTDSTWAGQIARLKIREVEDDEQHSYQDKKYSYKINYHTDHTNRSKNELFEFDPNQTSDSDWRRLGLRDKTIGTIQKYLRKGGRFRQPEDLKKVYGLFEDEYERLEPYITIKAEARRREENEIFTRQQVSGATMNNEPGHGNNYGTKKIYSVIEINSADTSDLISLPGIGSKLAARIVSFRDKLGGFYMIEQVGETFGLPDSTFQKIKQWLKLDKNAVRKININTATLEQLKAHPYIRYALAKPIVAYRDHHGAFLKVEDVKKIMAVSEDVYDKIRNYLVVE